MQGTMPGARWRGRPRTAWLDNIKTWTGLAVKESIRMTEDRDKRRKYVHGVANPRIKHGRRLYCFLPRPKNELPSPPFRSRPPKYSSGSGGEL